MATFYRAYQPTRVAFLRAVDRLSTHSSVKVCLYSQPTGLRGPESEPLVTDLCTFSSISHAPKLLLITTGLHGCELFSGSAVVREFMARVGKTGGAVLGDVEVAVVHAVNSFEGAWLRRPNANNVDLNRNFIADIEELTERMKGGEEFAWVRELDRKFPFLDTSLPHSYPLLEISRAVLTERYSKLRSHYFCANPHFVNYGGSTLQPDVLSFTVKPTIIPR